MAAADTKARSSRRQLHITGSAHKARVIGDAGEAAILAAFNMAAERRHAAGRDRSDHPPFDAPEMSGVRPFVTLVMAAEDVGQFERRPRRHPYPGGVTFRESRSRGLAVLPISCVETRV